jgi:DNA (cytosine-5)-methyltransferase 1
MDIISFFTGGGFMDIGFQQAGYRVLWTNEYDNRIADLHDAGNTALWGRLAKISSRDSICDLTAKEVRSQAAPEGDFGVIGGPPCQSFSIAGNQQGRKEKRGQLAEVYVDMAIALNPLFVVMENVPGLCKIKKNREYLEYLRLKFESAGYATDLCLANALKYGVPQDRERMFLVAIKANRLNPPPNKDPFGVSFMEGWFQFGLSWDPTDVRKEYGWPTTNPFGQTPRKPGNIPEDLMVCRLLEDAEQKPNGKEWFTPKTDRLRTVAEGDVDRKSCKRLHRYRYSPTVCYGNNEVHFHPWLPRRLSVREALRIQTVPDDYVLPSNAPLTAKFKMISNGVPCRMAQALAVHLKNYIDFHRTSR